MLQNGLKIQDLNETPYFSQFIDAGLVQVVYYLPRSSFATKNIDLCSTILYQKMDNFRVNNDILKRFSRHKMEKYKKEK